MLWVVFVYIIILLFFVLRVIEGVTSDQGVAVADPDRVTSRSSGNMLQKPFHRSVFSFCGSVLHFIYSENTDLSNRSRVHPCPVQYHL